MRVVVITPPTAVIDVEEAKDHLEVEHDNDDAKIQGMVAAATSHVDGPDGWLGRAIGVQTLEARFSTSACYSVKLPYPPFVDLVSVKYLGADDVERTASADDFEFFGSEMSAIGAWPWTGGSTRREAVRVQYRAGYETLPPAIRAAILLMVGDLYRNRESATAGTAIKVPMSTTVENLLGPFRKWAP